MGSAFHSSQPFELGVLLLPAITLYLGLLVLGYAGSKSLTVALLVATVKTALFAVYFGYFFDGTYTSVDDEYYLNTGQQILLLLSGDMRDISIDQLRAIVGGAHYVYNLLNTLSFYFFGEYYFSPIVLNILISALTAVLAVTIARQQQLMAPAYLPFFFLFFCLHPEILSWSTVFNGKDILVLLMNVLLVYSVSLFILHRKIAALLAASIAVFVLYSLRFYVPLMFGLSFLIYLILDMKLDLKKVLNFGFAVGLFLLFVVPWDFLSYSFEIYRNSFINPITGAVHFMLTPRPFFTDSIHGFLDLASLFNWFFFPLFLVGFYLGWKSKHSFIYFLIAYFAVFVLFYGGFYDLNGPRHRLQLLFVVSAFQFIGIQWLFRQIMSKRPTGSAEDGAPAAPSPKD